MAKAVALCITDLDVGGAEQCLVKLALRVDPARYSPPVYNTKCQKIFRGRRLDAANVFDHHFLSGLQCVSFHSPAAGANYHVLYSRDRYAHLWNRNASQGAVQLVA